MSLVTGARWQPASVTAAAESPIIPTKPRRLTSAGAGPGPESPGERSRTRPSASAGSGSRNSPVSSGASRVCQWRRSDMGRSVMAGGAVGGRLQAPGLLGIGQGLPVAVEAPAHGHGLVLADADHGVHRAMTGLAGHSGRDVVLVTEPGEVGEPVHPDPLDGPVLLHGLGQRLDVRRVLLHLAVATETELGRRHTGVTALGRTEVAVLAVHLELTGMQGVGE